jgi:hypothetical protein
MEDEIPEAGSKVRAFSIGTPHADTGVRETRELISSGKAFAVLTPISLIPQIARGCKEQDMDEAIAEKVNKMTKIVMASTADAWLIHTPARVDAKTRGFHSGAIGKRLSEFGGSRRLFAGPRR